MPMEHKNAKNTIIQLLYNFYTTFIQLLYNFYTTVN